MTKYPLLPYSRLVYDMERWMPRIYRGTATLRFPHRAGDKERVEQALRAAVANHPVFRMRTDRHGNHYDAPLPDPLHGRYHDLAVQAQGEDLLLTASMDRILGDGRSIAIALDDFCRAYRGEQLPPDDYWAYVDAFGKSKLSARYANSRAWLLREFADQTVPVHPKTDRRLWTLLPPKAGLLTEDYTALLPAIQRLSGNSLLSLDGFFSLCAALAVAGYNGTAEAALTWAYEGRERPGEQRVFGSLHRDIPFHIRRSADREALLKETRAQMRSGIARSDYPYTLTPPYTKRWNYAVNVLRIPSADDLLSLFPITAELLPAPPQKYAYALLDIEIHGSQDSLNILYRYSATHYKEESIRRFAALLRQNAEWLLK